MESRDLKIVYAIACLSVAIIISSVIIANSISKGLTYQGGWIDSAGNKLASSVASVANNQQKLQAESDILNEEQAATYLQLSKDELTALLNNSKSKDGKGIPHFEIGTRVFFSKMALSKWVINIAENNFEY